MEYWKSLSRVCLANEYYWFARQLRRETFERFGYGLGGVSGARINRMGFKPDEVM